MLSVPCAGRKDTLRRLLVSTNKGSGKGKESKARKARKAKGKAQSPRMVTPRRKVLAITVVKLVTLRVNVRRRKSQTMQVPVVEVMCIV